MVCCKTNTPEYIVYISILSLSQAHLVWRGCEPSNRITSQRAVVLSTIGPFEQILAENKIISRALFLKIILKPFFDVFNINTPY